MRLDAAKECLACDYCGTLHFPEADEDGICLLGAASALSCPLCKVALLEAEAAGRPLLSCERCRGALIRMDVFADVIGALRRKTPNVERPLPFDHRELGRVLVCPQCGGRMDTHPYAGPGAVVIDSCSACHLIWLDHSELRRLAAAPEPKHFHEDPPPSASFSGEG